MITIRAVSDDGHLPILKRSKSHFECFSDTISDEELIVLQVTNFFNLISLINGVNGILSNL